MYGTLLRENETMFPQFLHWIGKFIGTLPNKGKVRKRTANWVQSDTYDNQGSLRVLRSSFVRIGSSKRSMHYVPVQITTRSNSESKNHSPDWSMITPTRCLEWGCYNNRNSKAAALMNHHQPKHSNFIHKWFYHCISNHVYDYILQSLREWLITQIRPPGLDSHYILWSTHRYPLTQSIETIILIIHD